MGNLGFCIRITCRLVVFLAGLCAVVLGLSRALVNPEQLPAVPFDLCDGTPCFLGISPGVTGWSDAQQRLSTAPNNQVYANEIVALVHQETTAALYPSINRLTVGRIYVHFSDDSPPSTGWIVERYGIPCGVSVYFSTGILTLRYPGLLVDAHLTHDWLSVETPVSIIHFADPNFRSTTQPDLCVDNVTSGGMINRPWYGFSSIGFYRSHRAGG